MNDLDNQFPQDAQVGKALVKQRALNALTFLLAAAVCGEAYLLWEMNDRVDQVMHKLTELEQNGTAADWKVIPNAEQSSDAADPQFQSSDPQLDPFGLPAPLFDPFSDLNQARRQMNEIMRQMRSDSIQYSPRAERLIRKTSPSQKLRLEDVGDAYVATVDLPGVDEANVTVSVNKNGLSVSAKHEDRNNVKTISGQPSRQERIIGQTVWTAPLVHAVDETKMKSCLKDGVLTITIPKRAVD